MSKFTKYIKRYWRSTESLAGGLKTSIKVFFRKKVTEQYPENRHTTLYIPERHRAQLEMIHDDRNQHHCVACGLCQMACPNDTIRVVSEVREDAEGKKKKFLVKYEYDLGSCMFCQLCVNACPYGTMRTGIASFVSMPVRMVPYVFPMILRIRFSSVTSCCSR